MSPNRLLLPFLASVFVLSACGDDPVAPGKPRCDAGGAACAAGLVCEDGACVGGDGTACGPAAPCAAGLRCIDEVCRAPASPVLEAVEPSIGAKEGGTTVRLTGSGFVEAMTVRFGAAEATEVTRVSSTELSARTPAGPEGPVDVTVAAPGGESSTLAGGYVYGSSAGALVIRRVVPSSGPVEGGTRGVLDGDGFEQGAQLYVGGIEATRTMVLDAHRMVFTTPPGAAGVVDVLVLNPGARAARSRRAFTYFAPTGPQPVLAGVFPARVAEGDRRPVEARGQHLGDVVLGFVDDVPVEATNPVDGSVTFTPPPDLAPGSYDVTVTTADGRTATLEDALEVLAPACADHVRNGGESDVDCGGSCEACADGSTCEVDTDCLSGVCEAGLCRTPACDDRTKNGDESDLDCGGSCAACDDLQGCRVAADCASSVCEGGVCAVPACDDRVGNGLESDVDCGGGCPGCEDGLACLVAADCRSGVCAEGVCAAPACDDRVRNGVESDVDCGGSCAACDVGQGCGSGADCGSGVCTSGMCAAPACNDEVRNGVESDVDCGGSCAACDVGQVCGSAADCGSGVCTDGVCAAPACDDEVQNGAETDVDCGGTCPGCANDARCAVGSDCASGVCLEGLCQAASCSDKVQNGEETDVDCGASCGPCVVTVSTNVNLSAASIVPGRTCADAASFAVLGLTSTTATLATAPASCLQAGDEVLLVHLQGTAAAATNIGVHERLPVASVEGSTVTFERAKTRHYGEAPDSDAGIGTGAGAQHVALVRVPKYRTLAVASGGSITVDAWDGTKGGVLALSATTLQLDGRITVKSKGYRDGRYSVDGRCMVNVTTEQGESFTGPGTQSTAANGGGSGGIGAASGPSYNSNTPMNASAGHASNGQPGVNANGRTLGPPGGTYGSSSGERLTLGSGVGGNLSCRGDAGGPVISGTRSSYAGGAILLDVGTLNVGSTGRIEADAAPSGRDGAPSGGTVVIRGGVVNLGALRVTASGAVALSGSPPTVGKENRGSDGYVVVHYTTSVTGTTAPSATVTQLPGL